MSELVVQMMIGEVRGNEIIPQSVSSAPCSITKDMDTSKRYMKLQQDSLVLIEDIIEQLTLKHKVYGVHDCVNAINAIIQAHMKGTIEVQSVGKTKTKSGTYYTIKVKEND